jgi:GH25 family lysozyme M1 (1,4-beta-N-acetylmuramidase)
MTTAKRYRRSKRKLRRNAAHPKALARRIKRLGKKPAGQFADLSSNNGLKTQADFDRYAKNGHNLVVIKATEGISYTNPEFAEQVRMAKRAGLIVMAYHFAKPGEGTAKAQAEHFVHTCKSAGMHCGRRRRFWFMRDELPGCLDYEVEGGHDEAFIQTFKKRYRALTDHNAGRKRNRLAPDAGPVLYGGSVIRETCHGTINLLFWLAAYVSSPGAYWPAVIPRENHWSWQYGDDVDLGFGPADASRYFGSIRDLIRLAI